MCDRIVVFDGPLRLIGRLVDVNIQAAAAWTLAGDVADGLAEAVPLEHLFEGIGSSAMPPPTALYEIDLHRIAGAQTAPPGRAGQSQSETARGA
jgi:hypothetical protein